MRSGDLSLGRARCTVLRNSRPFGVRWCGRRSLLSLPGRLVGQAPTIGAHAKTVSQTWTPPRTADGHPDIQGVWANNNATPLQRPKALAGRPSLTDQEVAALKKKAAERHDGAGDTEFGDTYYETVWTAVQNVGSPASTKKG